MAPQVQVMRDNSMLHCRFKWQVASDKGHRLFPVVAGSNKIQTITTKITNESPKTCHGHIIDTSIGMGWFEDLVDI